MREHVAYKVEKARKSSLIIYQNDLSEKIERIFGENVVKDRVKVPTSA